MLSISCTYSHSYFCDCVFGGHWVRSLAWGYSRWYTCQVCWRSTYMRGESYLFLASFTL